MITALTKNESLFEHDIEKAFPPATGVIREVINENTYEINTFIVCVTSFIIP